MARSPKPQRKQSQRTPESRDPGSVSNENRSSLSEYDKKILAAPTPLELAPTPGSETIHPYAQAAYDDMQTSLDSLVGAIKQDYDNGNRSGNIHVSPGGPGLDTLNLIALVSHQKSGEKGHYKPTDTPNASLAQQTITAFPNPKDLLIAANTHIEQLSILNQRRGITIDQAHERNTLYRLMKTIYGERFSEFQTQAVAEAQAAQEAEAKSVLEQQLEEAVKYKGREVLGNSKSATLRRREWVNKKHHELQSRAAERRNALSTPKHIILAWRKNRAEARLRRKQNKLGVSMFKKVNTHRANSATKASKKLSEITGVYAAHKSMMDKRSARVEEEATVRANALKERIAIYSEQKLKAYEDRERRRLVARRRTDAITNGHNEHEARIFANQLTDTDKKIIRANAVMAAKRDARADGYNESEDHDRN